ncbi:MAG: hypothetical protein QXU20_04450 [Candidatus Woesearchaeota archaeon]
MQEDFLQEDEIIFTSQIINKTLNKLREELKKKEEIIENLKQENDFLTKELLNEKSKTSILSNNLNELAEKLYNREEELKSLKEKLSLNEERISELKNKLEIYEKSLEQKNLEIEKLRKDFENFKSENIKLRDEKIGNLKDEFLRIKAELLEKEKLLKNFFEEKEKKDSTIKTLQEQNNDLKKELEERESEIQALKSKVYELLEQNSKIREESLNKESFDFEKLEKENSLLKSTIDDLEEEIRILKENSYLKEQEIESLKTKNQLILKEFEDLRRINDILNQKINELNKQLSSANEELFRKQSLLIELHKNFGNFESELLKKQETVQILSEEVKKLNSLLRIDEETIKKLSSEIESLKLKNNELFEKIKERERIIFDYQAEISRLKATHLQEIETLREKLQKDYLEKELLFNAKIKELQDKNNKLESELAEKNKLLSQTNSIIKELKDFASKKLGITNVQAKEQFIEREKIEFPTIAEEIKKPKEEIKTKKTIKPNKIESYDQNLFEDKKEQETEIKENNILQERIIQEDKSTDYLSYAGEFSAEKISISKEELKSMVDIALQHGDSLQSIYESLINSGYPKEVVEEVIKEFQK